MKEPGGLQGQSVSGLAKVDNNEGRSREGRELEVNPEFKYGMSDEPSRGDGECVVG